MSVIDPHPLVRPCLEVGHAVVRGQDWIDERMVTVEEIEHREIPPDHINEETDGLFKHRLAQFVVEAFEVIVDGADRGALPTVAPCLGEVGVGELFNPGRGGRVLVLRADEVELDALHEPRDTS